MWASWFRRIPLFGGLVDCDSEDHLNALGETIVILVLSLAPIWLGALVIYDIGSASGFDAFKVALYTTVVKGELFTHCATMLAPICWIVLVDPPRSKVFPTRVAHILLVIVIDLIAGVFYGLGASGQKLHELFTFRLSLYMFLSSIGLLYLATVYHASISPDPVGEFEKEEQDFSNAVREHRR